MAEGRSVLAAIHRELCDAERELRPVRQIRVSITAIPGSPVATPISPERLRTMALRAVPADDEVVVVADPEAERWLEILLHPEDWRSLLRDVLGPDVDPGIRDGVKRVLGVPVRGV